MEKTGAGFVIISNTMRRIFPVLVLALLPAIAFAGKPIRVACVGNSITYGMQLPDRETQNYPVQLQGMLGNKYEVRNFGVSGATLLRHGQHPYVTEKAYQDALNFAADIVVIHLGINDTDPRSWPNYKDNFIGDYLNLIHAFRKTNPKMRIIIARLTPISNRHKRFLSGTRDWHDEIQEAIETVAKVGHTELIDFFTPLHPRPDVFPDGLHPDPEGAKILAETAYKGITGDYGGLQLPDIYTSNMVLQRNEPIVIRGTANVGDMVKVGFAGKTAVAKTGTNGKWEVCFGSMEAGGQYDLTVECNKKKVCLSNILVGEVWLCSGQSNMEFMLKQAATAARDVPAGKDDMLRLYDQKARWRTDATEWGTTVLDSVNRLQYYGEAQWMPCDSVQAASFSAVAYYFGKMLRDSLKVPVGLICNAVGGSGIESWIDRKTLEHDFPAILNDWTHNDFIQDWVRDRAALNMKESTNPLQRHPYEPAYLYEASISGLAGFPIKGVVWYQGESNAHNYEAYEQLFRLMVRSWRGTWQKPDLPFCTVQLSSIDRPSWTWFRDCQRRLAATTPDCYMAVSSDAGDSLDVHPKQKQQIGVRLGRLALHHVYGHSLTSSGPYVESALFKDGEVEISFGNGKGLRTSDGKTIRGFEVAEYDGLFYPADVIVEGNRITLKNPAVEHPKYVRYAWKPYTTANLTNDELLPCGTFRIAR